MFWPGDESSFFSQATVGQAITSPPWRVRGTFSCHLRNHPHYLIRDRLVIADEGALDDHYGCYFRLRRISFGPRRQLQRKPVVAAL